MNEARQNTLVGKMLMPVVMLQAFLLSAVTAFAQDAPKDVNVDINMHGSGAGAGGWYTMWWVWVIIAVFIIVIVALTTRGGGTRSE